jgi:hypothetical protein
MRIETLSYGEIPVPCDCALGYHHRPDGEPLIEHDEVTGDVITHKGRHPYCIGACKVWGTPTEEFDFRLVTGRRTGPARAETGIQVTDYTNPHGIAVSWDNDSIPACSMLGLIRMTSWQRTHPTPYGE